MELFFRVISFVAGIIVLSTLIHAYVMYPTESIFGERFVLYHYKLNTPFYNFHFKPITIIILFAFIFWVCGLESLNSILSAKSLLFKRLIFIISFIFTLLFFYEVIQVALGATAIYIINSGKIDPDSLHTGLIPGGFQSPSGLKVNFIVMSKFYTFIFFINLYNLYFFFRIMKVKQR